MILKNELGCIEFNHKKIRAEVIKRFVGDRKIVCFSCGNASQALIDVGLDVLCIGGYNGILHPTRWFSKDDIANYFSDRFDATCGHLPPELMAKLAMEYRKYVCDFDMSVPTYIPTGSGETLVCLKLVCPDARLIAVYNQDNATLYNEQAPLNKMVELLADDIIK